MNNLDHELNSIRQEIEEHARNYGLDFFPTIFQILDYDMMNQVASYGGFPTRYPHWRFGMEYERMSKSYAYGLQRIYEMVINNNPAYAYLLEGNELVDQKMVIAHVYAHVDFFKNNLWFSRTNRKMMDEMANHASRIRKYIDKFGQEEVEDFIDLCLSIDNLIDRHSPFINRTGDTRAAYRARLDLPQPSTNVNVDSPNLTAGRYQPTDEGDEQHGYGEEMEQLPLLHTDRDYMHPYLNPQEFIDEQRRKLHEKKQKREERFPGEPVRDVLYFLMENAPLKAWQLDVMSIIREEAYYYAPQGQTKILNEGWATFWHSRIMTQKVLKDSELIDYALHHSGTVATSQSSLNPYKLGVELLRNIEDRWNRGCFGKEYEDCDRLEDKLNWNRDTGLGTPKIMEVRQFYNDVTLIDEFLTPEFCMEQQLFTFGFNNRAEQWEILSRDFGKIKEKLLFQLTNLGQPDIRVENGNYRNRGEMLLHHNHRGFDLKPDYARDTLINLHKIWRRPVHIRTIVNGKGKIMGFDGKDFEDQAAE